MSNAIKSIWIRYWNAYGGIQALCQSIYLWIAILLTLVGWKFWSKEDWWEIPLSVLPNLLGFSLGGLAILLGLIQPKIMAILSQKSDATKTSTMSQFTATFTHFVLVQASALVTAIVFKSLSLADDGQRILMTQPSSCLFEAVSGLGWLLFIYAVLLVFAVAIEVFRLSEMLQVLSLVPDDNSHTLANKSKVDG